MTLFQSISGGVTAPLGFTASGVHCGVKTPDPTATTLKKDVALILSDCDCAAAGVFTKNQVKAAPCHLSKRHLQNGRLRGIVANSGNANACAPMGDDYALRMAECAAMATGLKTEDFGVCSTGIIGVTLPIETVEKGIRLAASALHEDGSGDASDAILTTDLVTKEIAVSLEIGGKTVKIGAIAKGSGMIHPNMGTMLCFVTTDCNISSELLQKALLSITKTSFNRVTVDGDTSTNDTCLVLANGMAQNEALVEGTAAYEAFYQALHHVCEYEAKMIAGDGEGASHLVACTVSGATTEDKAELMAMSVVGSPLVKAAMFGADANWGRVLCAIGYSGASFDPEAVDVSFHSDAGSLTVCEKGRGLSFDEELAKKVLSERDITIAVTMAEGTESATCWGCDLTYDYVKINGDYRS